MHTRFHAAFTALPTGMQLALRSMLDTDDFPAFFTAEQVTALKAATGLESRELSFALLPLAASCAVTPLSGFNVGALALGKSGHLYFGANMEFRGATLQQTVHAEQSAITHAWQRGEKALEAVTVNYTPCGYCRQFMNELNSGTSLRIHLPGREPATLGDYLPDAFGPRDLGTKTLLLDEIDNHLLIQGESLTQAALRAANCSYAPYSGALSGVALMMTDGAVFTGSYAENAAFNPSLSPLQAALIMLNMSGRDMLQIQRAVLAESSDAQLIQQPATAATLQTLGCDDLLTVSLS